MENEYLLQYELGILEFNSGKYFEAHDTLEDLWMQTRGEYKKFIQGLIQISVGTFHLTNKNYSAAESQYQRGLTKIKEFENVNSNLVLGVNILHLISQVNYLRSLIKSLLQSNTHTLNYDELPLIEYSLNKDVTLFFEKNY